MSGRITTDQIIAIANNFCGKYSISSFKKREALAVLITEVYFAGYETGIDDLKDKLREKERANV